MKSKTLKLDQISTTDGTQVRALNLDVVGDYQELLGRSSDSLPPVDVFGDGTTFWMADGFHRHEAAKQAGLETIVARVRDGGRLDALMYALGANIEHGYRRTRADKRNAVLLAFKEFDGRSDRYYADLCKVSPTYVGTLRQELRPPTVHVDSSGAINGAKRIGRDGKTRKLPESSRLAPDTIVLPGANGCTRHPQPHSTTVMLRPLPKDPDEQHGAPAGFETKFIALDKLCRQVVAASEFLLASSQGREGSQVRSKLNELRAELERLTTDSLAGMTLGLRLPCDAKSRNAVLTSVVNRGRA